MAARGIVVVLSLFATSAAAQPSDLAWQAPASCPDAASVRARIEQRLGQSLEDMVVGIDVAIARQHGQFVARIDLGAVTVATDVRTLTSAHCDELADAVALIVARVASERRSARDRRVGGHRSLAPSHDTDHARRRASSDVATRADATHDDASPSEPRDTTDDHASGSAMPDDARRDATHDAAGGTETRRDAIHDAASRSEIAARDANDAVDVHRDTVIAPAPPRLWSIGVRLSGVSGIGVVPQVGLGAEVALTLRHRSTLAEIGETSWLTSGAEVHVGAPARVDVGLDVTAARIGWRPEDLPLRAWATAEVGSMQGAGSGLANPLTGSGRWVAAGAGFGVAWQMTRWARLVGSTEVLGAFERVRFTLGDGVVVFAPSPVSARASCGIEVGWQ